MATNNVGTCHTSPAQLTPTAQAQIAWGRDLAANPKMNRTFKAGSILDTNKLHKWMSLQDLLHHLNPVIYKWWGQSGEKEIGNLFQGYNKDTDGMNVCTFLHWSELPTNQKITYSRTVVAYWPEKDDPYCTWINVSGGQLNYEGKTATYCASMMTIIKCIWNSVLLDKGAKYCTCRHGWTPQKVWLYWSKAHRRVVQTCQEQH